MPTLTFGADASRAIAEFEKVNQAALTSSQKLGQLLNVTKTYNDEGVLVSKTIQTQASAFTTLTQRMGLVDGALTVLTQSYKTNTAAARENAAAQLAAQKAATINANKDAVASRKVFYDYVKQAEREQEQRVLSSLAKQKAANIAANKDAIASRKTLADYIRAQNERDAAVFEQSNRRAAARRAQRDREDAAYAARRSGGPGGPSDADNRRASAFEGIMNRIGRNLVQFASFRAFNVITQGLTDGVKAAKDFEIQLSLIRTISQDSQQTFSKFGQDVRNVSDSSGIDIQQVGKAFFDTISNQIAKGAAVKDFVKTATDLARITGSELPDATNLLSSAINSYGLSATDAERVSAIFFRTIDEGRIVAGELANTFGRVGVLGSNLGVDIESLNAVLAITTQKGFKTADAMTLLTNLLIKLEKPTDATRAFFADLGVDSGEAAIKLFGFTGVLQKMVDSVRAGRVDVSAFFDEIRGRKQFGIFEQSIGDIKRFESQLKNISGTQELFEKAKEIRGESNADLLVKEFNKLSNIFKVDFGQEILRAAADATKFVGGVDALKNASQGASEALKLMLIGVTAFALRGPAAAAGAALFANGLRAITIGATSASLALVRLLAPLAAVTTGYIAFKQGQKLFGEQSTEGFGFDIKAINSSIEALDRFTAAEKLRQRTLKDAIGGNVKSAEGAFDGIENQKKIVGDTFKEALGFIAQATIANNRFLDDARNKSKEVSEALRISFATWVDRLQSNIATIKGEITSARNEIEKSVKAQTTFQESIADAKFSTDLKYASDDIRIGNQKEAVLQRRIEQLQRRAEQLFNSGSADELAEGRKLFDEIVNLEQQKFDIQTEFRKKQFERDVQGNPGLNIFEVDTSELNRRLDALEAKKANYENASIARQQQLIQLKQKEVELREAELRSLQAAFKTYEDLEIFNKEGKVKPEFADKDGRFDRAKVSKELETIEATIRKNAGGTHQERVQLEIELAKKRRALFTEAAAQERADSLKTAQSRIISSGEAANKELEDLKKVREAKIAEQQSLARSLGAKSNELAAFATKLFAGGQIPENIKAGFAANIEEFKRQTKAAFDDADRNAKDGIPVFDPEKLARLAESYDIILGKIEKARDLTSRKPDLTLTEGGRSLTPGDGRSAFRQEIGELEQNRLSLLLNRQKEEALRDSFAETFKAQVDDLNRTVPELAGKASEAARSIDSSFKSLSNGGIKELRDQLIEIERLMRSINNGVDAKQKISAVDGVQPAYAASGGIAGLFPGQPRGIDKYPVWMAAGERVLDRATSSLYAPMLDAMVNRRMPSYMANGGIAGDTQVGDISINVSVQGGSSGAQTGRQIANELRRELRRNNIRL